MVDGSNGHAYLLTPEIPAAAPEPATVLLLGQGAAALLSLA
ncbi:MAG TPA: hypothetical protein VMF69_13950 [Gemmataceae bacterium]|nr:hypothetical protein [Gemmataceae bacterium]